MTSIDRSDPVILGHMLAEHRELFTLIQSVRTALAAPGEPTPNRRAAVMQSLRSLRCHLHDHFSQEECGGFMEEAVARIPRLSAAMQSILGQHPDLLAELDHVIAGLESAPDAPGSWWTAGRDQESSPDMKIVTPPGSWFTARTAFEAFANHMSAHEQRENAVVQEGYCEDLGLCE